MIAYVVGTLDTKGAETAYVAGLLDAAGVTTRIVDVSTTGEGGREVAAHHPEGVDAVLTGDRGTRGHRDGRRPAAATSARATTWAVCSASVAPAAPR